MAPKRKRKPAAKATTLGPAKRTNGDVVSTPVDRVVLRNKKKVSKKPILIPARPKRKPPAYRGVTANQPDAATETQPPVVFPAVPDPPLTHDVSATRTCRTCGVSKPCTNSNSEFAGREDLPACKHPDHNICRPCLAEHIAQLWSQGGINKVACPECRAPIQLRTLEKFCGPQIRESYISLTGGGGNAPEAHPSWRWCLYPPCTAGQTHLDPQDPVVECEKCGFSTCFEHRVPWHEEYTCAEFADKAAVDIERSERYIRFSMARCPSCGFYVEKSIGCDNIKCRCGAFWRYVTGVEGLGKMTLGPDLGYRGSDFRD